MTRPHASRSTSSSSPEYEIDLVAGEITVSIDEADETIEVSIEPAEEDGDSLVVTLSKEQAAAFAIRAVQLIEAGRPPCPLCGLPLDPRGHDCPRTNGHHAPLAVSRPDDERTREVLAEGSLEIHGRVPDSSNATLLVTARLAPTRCSAVYKPEHGERPLWDFPPACGAARWPPMSSTCCWGPDCVPLTIARDADFGPGSIQRWVHEEGVEHYLTLRGEPGLAGLVPCPRGVRRRREQHGPQVRPRALGERPVLGDRQRAVLHVDDKLCAPYLGVRGEPLPPRAARAARHGGRRGLGVLGGLLGGRGGRGDAATPGRLAEDGVLPVPDEDGRYPPGPGRSSDWRRAADAEPPTVAPP